MKPMLACSKQPDINNIKYPKIASYKLDGIRCLMKDGVALSRSLKPIPNLFIQRELGKLNLHGLDGELMIEGDFNDVQSAVMSVHGEPDFTYYVFDKWDSKYSFFDRVLQITKLWSNLGHYRIKVLSQLTVNSPEEVSAIYSLAMELGHEGLILKDPDSPYKFGRSTLKQEWMLKLKQVIDDEATVIGFHELRHNENDPTIDNVGNQVRSDHQANLVDGDTLGALIVTFSGKIFNIGSGFDLSTRQKIWDNKEEYRGKLVKFKHLGFSKYGVPRCPIFLGFRDKRDL